MQCRFFRVFIVRISLLERDLKRVTKWIASESVHLNRRSSKSERNQSGRTVKRSVKLQGRVLYYHLFYSLQFFRFFFFPAVLMLLIKISVVCTCNEGAQVSRPLFLCFKENIKTYTLSNFPFGMYLPFLAWPTLSRVIDDNCRALNWFNVFFKLKLAKPQKFAEFTLFWYCTSAKSNLPLSDPAQVYFHLRSDAIFPSNKPIFISDRPIRFR